MLKGLLDTLNSEEGQLGLAMLAAAGPQAQPMSFGQRMAGVMQQQQARKQAEEDRKLKQLMTSLQMDELLTRRTERQDAIAEKNRTRERTNQFYSELQPKFTTSEEVLANGGGLTPENASRVGQPKPLDLQRLALQFPDQLPTIKALAEAQNFGRNKVARTVEVMGPNGRPQTVQLDDYGNQIGGGLSKPVEMKLQDLGGSVVGYDPFSGALTGAKFDKTMTPGELATNRLGWANNAVSRERLALDQSQTGKPTFHDGFWLTPPSKDNPTGTAVKIPGFDKPLNEQQGNATNFLGRMRNASEVINQIEGGAYTDTKGNTRSLTPDKVSGAIAPSFVESASGVVPFIGDDLASRARSGNDLRSVYRQAQVDWVTANLRKESGAVIGAEEMDNEVKKYFPQRGDSPEVVRRKAESRSQAELGMSRQAGPGANMPTVRSNAPKAESAAPLPPNPKASELRKGQRYELPNGDTAVWDGLVFRKEQ